jgi:CIC family chloride channel protein
MQRRPALQAHSLEQRRTITLTAGSWEAVLGVVSGMACVGVRLFFRLLQWVFVKHTGLLPESAASVSPMRRFLTPVLGALGAMAVLWAVRRWSRAGHFEEYVEAVRFQEVHIAFMSTLWRTLSSAFSVATGAAIGREGVHRSELRALNPLLFRWTVER